MYYHKMIPRTIASIFTVITGLALFLAVPHQAYAAGVVGTGTPASCTEAALDAALAGGGVVTFNCGTPPHIINTTGTKFINGNTTIDGGGLITIAGNNTFQLFYTEVDFTVTNLTLTGGGGHWGGTINNKNATLTVDNVTFTNNSATKDGGALYNNSGTLNISNSIFTNNTAPELGGAIHSNTGTTLTVMGSSFTQNSAIGGSGSFIRGGAIFLADSGTLTVTNSTFTQNTADKVGGAIALGANDVTFAISGSTFTQNSASWAGTLYFGHGLGTIVGTTFSNNTTSGRGTVLFNYSGSFNILNSTFANNTTGDGGGAIEVDDGAVTVANSTFSGNTVTGSSNGGAILVYSGTLTVINSTFSNNTATSGSGGAIAESGGTVTVKNSILANNSPNNCTGTITEGVAGSNLEGPSGATSCGFSKTSTDPQLSPLADNGGSPQTMALAASSPAIDAGDNTTCAAAPINNKDQRGTTRPIGVTCDIGAFEAEASLLVVSKVVNPITANVGETVTYTYRITNTGNVTLTSVTATDDLLGAVTLGTTTLSADQSTTSVLTYTIIAGDKPGPVINIVTINGIAPSSAVVTTTDSAVVGIPDKIDVVTNSLQTEVYTTTDNNVVIQIPPASLPGEANQLQYIARGITPTTTTEDGLSSPAFAIAFEMDLLKANGDIIASPTFTSPITVTITYSQSVIDAQGLDEAKLAVVFFNTTTGKWEALEIINRDTTNNTITFVVNHLTEFTLLEESSGNIFLPIILKN